MLKIFQILEEIWVAAAFAEAGVRLQQDQRSEHRPVFWKEGRRRSRR